MDLLKIAGMVFVLLWTLGADCARCDGKAAEQPDMGELKIEGKFIKLLVLDSKEGDAKEIREPGESVKLPAGKYRVQEVYLEGGFTCRPHQIPNRDWVIVAADNPAVLKLGAPLKQKVIVKHRGTLLVLSHELVGIGGEKYTRLSRDNLPKFAIHKGQERIGDGSSEYGYGSGGVCSYSWRVPFATHAELKIVASQDIGELGAKDSEPVTYNWKWHYNIPGLLVWVILILSLVLVRANRNRRALLVFIPLLITTLWWMGFANLTRMPLAQKEICAMVFQSLCVGLAVLWLLGEKIANRKRYVTFLSAFAVLAATVLAGAISYGMVGLSGDALGTMILLATFIVTLLFSFVLSGWRCRKFYGVLRFALWQAIWCGGMSIAALCLLATVLMIIKSDLRSSWASLLIEIPIVGAISGLVCYALVLPFVILALKSPFFYRRFYACMRLQSMPATIGPDARAGCRGGQEAAGQTPGSDNCA